jgi:hypothetical protein
MRNSKNTTVRSYANNQLVKAYVDKSVKYKGYMPKYQLNQIIEESEGDSFDFNPELHSWVKETQEGNYLLVNKLPNGKLKAWYVNQTYNVLRGVIDAESEIEFSDSWESCCGIIPKVNILGKFRVSKLKCPRGLSMARFKNHCSVPSDSFLESYFANGGKVDGGGWSEPVWGFHPSSLVSFEEIGIDPCLLGRVFSVIGRVDYGHGDSIQEIVQLGLQPRNRKEYGRNCYGIWRRDLLQKFGVSHNKGIITLGYMSNEKFARLLVSKATVVSRELMESYITRYSSFVDLDDCINQAAYANRLMKYWFVCESKYRKRRKNSSLSEKASYKVIRKLSVFRCRKAIEFSFRRGKGIQLPGITMWAKKESSSTSIGTVFYASEGIDFSKEGKISGNKLTKSYWETKHFFNQAKKVSGYWVARELNEKTDKDLFFIWKDSFADHIEANSLREGLEILQKLTKKQSLILCLNDVRNDRTGTAGYCLAGTKSFAEARMPFMYRLIRQYNSWCDIPEDIMSLEFNLASKEIFNGFRNPVS